MKVKLKKVVSRNSWLNHLRYNVVKDRDESTTNWVNVTVLCFVSLFFGFFAIGLIALTLIETQWEKDKFVRDCREQKDKYE